MRPSRQVKRNMRESKQSRARRLRLARQQRFVTHMINAIRGMTGMVRAETEMMQAVAYDPFADILTRTQGVLDSAKRSLDAARDEVLAAHAAKAGPHG